jgi:hypothetical protein
MASKVYIGMMNLQFALRAVSFRLACHQIARNWRHVRIYFLLTLSNSRNEQLIRPATTCLSSLRLFASFFRKAKRGTIHPFSMPFGYHGVAITAITFVMT